MSETPKSNPYHPLDGPPKSINEKIKLNTEIKNEFSETVSSISDKQSISKKLFIAARVNCSDVLFDYTKCKISGSFNDQLKGCVELKRKFENCVEKQRKLLEKHGYKGDESRQDWEAMEKADVEYLLSVIDDRN